MNTPTISSMRMKDHVCQGMICLEFQLRAFFLWLLDVRGFFIWVNQLFCVFLLEKLFIDCIYDLFDYFDF